MLKAIVIVCPNDIRHNFCQNFFELLKKSDPPITFTRSIQETTEKEIEGLKQDEDYEYIKLKGFIARPKTYYIAKTMSKNGHVSRSGFSVYAYCNALHSGEIVIYDTNDIVLAERVSNHYQRCSDSYLVHISEILETGIEKEFEETHSVLVSGPDAHYDLYEHVLKLITSSLSVQA